MNTPSAAAPPRPGFDLAALDTKTTSEAGLTVHLEHPGTGEPLFAEDGVTPMTITVLGDDAGKVRSFFAQTWDLKAERVKKNRDYDMSYSTTERESARKLALATLRWTGIVLDGETLECNEGNAYRLYLDPRLPWIREQLTKAAGDRARLFTTGSRS